MSKCIIWKVELEWSEVTDPREGYLDDAACATRTAALEAAKRFIVHATAPDRLADHTLDSVWICRFAPDEKGVFVPGEPLDITEEILKEMNLQVLRTVR